MPPSLPPSNSPPPELDANGIRRSPSPLLFSNPVPNFTGRAPSPGAPVQGASELPLVFPVPRGPQAEPAALAPVDQTAPPRSPAKRAPPHRRSRPRSPPNGPAAAESFRRCDSTRRSRSRSPGRSDGARSSSPVHERLYEEAAVIRRGRESAENNTVLTGEVAGGFFQRLRSDPALEEDWRRSRLAKQREKKGQRDWRAWPAPLGKAYKEGPLMTSQGARFASPPPRSTSPSQLQCHPPQAPPGREPWRPGRAVMGAAYKEPPLMTSGAEQLAPGQSETPSGEVIHDWKESFRSDVRLEADFSHSRLAAQRRKSGQLAWRAWQSVPGKAYDEPPLMSSSLDQPPQQRRLSTGRGAGARSRSAPVTRRPAGTSPPPRTHQRPRREQPSGAARRSPQQGRVPPRRAEAPQGQRTGSRKRAPYVRTSSLRHSDPRPQKPSGSSLCAKPPRQRAAPVRRQRSDSGLALEAHGSVTMLKPAQPGKVGRPTVLDRHVLPDDAAAQGSAQALEGSDIQAVDTETLGASDSRMQGGSALQSSW
eukprot:TRINITY_DN1100_c1_g1_i1.p1 TRINITY_DN1100_c1_g1~~TRINITY_DN1100_c1_g1_i1.p1  ORF type:complete len:562 (+),score=120.11 TRINITY_DN1100_c1_g1_i1:84-1688(+)